MVEGSTRRASKPDPSDRTPAPRERPIAAQTLGAILRERRDAMGVSLAEVEIATRIRQKYLAAIESDEWHLLPGEVVGRGFLRNYAEYLGLESHEVNDRRRAMTDPGLAAALSTTSAGTELPPERQVDYRPKEVELKDEVDDIERGEIKLTPILSILAVAAVVALAGWGLVRLREPIGGLMAGVQSRVENAMAGDAPTATPELVGIVNVDNVGASSAPTTASLEQGGQSAPPPAEPGVQSSDSQPAGVVALVPTNTPTAAPAATNTPEPPTPEPPAPEPTATETPLPPPTETPTPEPPTPELPTPTPEVPTDTPTPEPPPVIAPACADPGSVIFSPGVNQAVSGVIGLSGTADIAAFQYYKLEFAPGANAGGGFVYFDGRNNPVSGGQLGAFDTTALPNGEYTLRLTVVDQTGNYLPPCDVSIIIQN